ncbi:MAG: cytochrome b [Legionellales bacterium]|nr:cytochrome b [Legionellales bacterium]
MLLKNTKERYGYIAMVLHWLIALIIIGMLCVGIYMVRLPISLEKLKLYGMHKEVGFLVLLLVILRLEWRLTNRVPALPDTMPTWQKWAAHGSHILLYLFMFAMPITGWLLTSAAGLPVSFFGLFVIPTIIPANPTWLMVFTYIHHWLGFSLIALLMVHTAAALQHHFIDKDTILRRMLP